MKTELNKKDVDRLVVENIKSIGHKIKLRRDQLHYTQFDLAVDSGCCLSLISELETGVSFGVSLRTLIKISEALEINLDYLFCK